MCPTSSNDPDNTLISTDTSLSPPTPILHSTFVSSTPAADYPGDVVETPVLNTTFVASTSPSAAEISDEVLTLTSTRKRTREVEDLPPAKRISRKSTITEFVAPKQPSKRTVTKSKKTAAETQKKKASLTIVTIDIPANIFDLEIVSPVAKPRRGRSAKNKT